jgi:hypothetical protein
MSVETPKFKHLNNTNYPEWSGEMKAWLRKLGYWSIVSGKETRPGSKEQEERASWDARADKAAAEIYLAVSNDQRVHFKGEDEDPVKMWKLLESAHVQKKPGAHYNAYNDLFSITKGDDETLVDMGTRVERAMANIKNLRPNNFTIDQLDEELQCMALIRAIPDEYKHLTASLLLQDSLTVDKVLQSFKSEELNNSK